MAKCGNKGSIIVDSSIMGSRVSALPTASTCGVYAASKAGADMLMKYAAIEVSLIHAVSLAKLPTIPSSGPFDTNN